VFSFYTDKIEGLKMSGSAKFQTYLVCCSLVSIWAYFYVGVNLNNSEMLIFVVILGGCLYLVFGKMLARMFQSGIDAKANKAYEDQQRQNEERQRNQRHEDQRKSLEIEFDHLAKIMMLQSNLDQGKLDKLQSMQTALKSAKNADLDTLRRQIEAMKRG
jgi:hypothetical protein